MGSYKPSTPCGYFCYMHPKHKFCLSCFRTQGELDQWVKLNSLQQEEVIMGAIKRMNKFVITNVHTITE